MRDPRVDPTGSRRGRVEEQDDGQFDAGEREGADDERRQAQRSAHSSEIIRTIQISAITMHASWTTMTARAPGSGRPTCAERCLGKARPVIVL
jgi:hypothetical protein